MSAIGKPEVGPVVPFERHLCECGALATVFWAPGGKLRSLHCDKHAPTLDSRGAT